MVLVMVLLLAKQIITLYHAVQKTLTKDQHALVTIEKMDVFKDDFSIVCTPVTTLNAINL
jgi:hypothetical protein